MADIRYSVMQLLNDRAPNYVSEWVILRRLRHHPQEKVRKILEALTNEEILSKEVDSHSVTGQSEAFYRCRDCKCVAVRKTIMIGDTPVPRLLSDSNPRFLPETLNEHTESIAEYSARLEERFKELVKKEQRQYWANVVGIVGLMISILAVIMVGLPKIWTDPNLAFWDVVLVNLAQLLPLAVVLVLLVVTLRLILR